MKILFGCAMTILTAVTLNAVCPAQSATNTTDSPKQKLIGAWQLAWIDEQAADGNIKRITDRQGTLLYTRDGHMSVQIMLPSVQSAPGGNPVKYDQAGYEAYFARTGESKRGGESISTKVAAGVPSHSTIERDFLRKTNSG